jgi:hypothetical protein
MTDDDECGVISKENRSALRIPAPVLLCPPQIPHLCSNRPLARRYSFRNCHEPDMNGPVSIAPIGSAGRKHKAVDYSQMEYSLDLFGDSRPLWWAHVLLGCVAGHTGSRTVPSGVCAFVAPWFKPLHPETVCLVTNPTVRWKPTDVSEEFEVSIFMQSM